MKTNNFLKTLKMGGLLKSVKQLLAFLVVLGTVAACGNDDPAADTATPDSTRAAADSTAAGDGFELHADTVWADTLRGSFDDYEVTPTVIDAADINEDGDARDAAARRRH